MVVDSLLLLLTFKSLAWLGIILSDLTRRLEISGRSFVRTNLSVLDLSFSQLEERRHWSMWVTESPGDKGLAIYQSSVRNPLSVHYGEEQNAVGDGDAYENARREGQGELRSTGVPDEVDRSSVAARIQSSASS
ncbi:hypothetical protein CEXT_169811 [Caerostris extrusa]|uniref:Uncharacterized protein n=1 Tax=Caerostris extrusa TaxID=172846 RepID=A0AAV4UN96_CAEEX|nr:hypothetical protein CEXT_169811 [Caerostris extrusa]